MFYRLFEIEGNEMNTMLCSKKFKKSSGFTLSEVMVTASTFLMLSLVLLGIMITALKYLRAAEFDINAQNNVAIAMDIICNEVRQGVPNLSGSTGFQTITPAVTSTAILMPNKNVANSNELAFNIPNFDGDGSGSAWDPKLGDSILQNPAYFKKIRYYVANNNALHREVTTYNSSGTADTPNDSELIKVMNPQGGSIQLQCTWLMADLIEVKITSVEGERTRVGTSKVYIMVRN